MSKFVRALDNRKLGPIGFGRNDAALPACHYMVTDTARYKKLPARTDPTFGFHSTSCAERLESSIQLGEIFDGPIS